MSGVPKAKHVSWRRSYRSTLVQISKYWDALGLLHVVPDQNDHDGEDDEMDIRCRNGLILPETVRSAPSRLHASKFSVIGGNSAVFADRKLADEPALLQEQGAEMTDEKKGWWSGKRYSVLGSQSFNIEWAATAIAIEALERGATFFDNTLTGRSKGSFNEFAERASKLGGALIYSNPPWRGDTSQSRTYVWPHSALAIWDDNGTFGGRVITMQESLYREAQALFEQTLGPRVSAGSAYVLVTTSNGPELQTLGNTSVPLERDNYNPEVLADYDAVVAELRSLNPHGRLAILDGEPGTGKTFMLRGLLADVPDAMFVVVPVNVLPELANPSMISALLQNRSRRDQSIPTIFLVEDADDCLASRDSGNASAVSALLNLGDGILGASLDIRLVCTTNLRDDDLDEAVKRPGRLSRKMHVDALKPDVAAKLIKKLIGQDVPVRKPMTLAEVYVLAKDKGWKSLRRKRSMGFGAAGEEVSEGFSVDAILAQHFGDD